MDPSAAGGIETWKEKACWIALGAILGSLPTCVRGVARRLRIMPKPRIDRVWIIGSSVGDDQWVKARVRLSRWLVLGNDAYLNCAVQAVCEPSGDPVPLLVSAVPEPMPAFSLEPGDRYEVQVAIWAPRPALVHMSRTLNFQLDGQEPRLLSHSRCYGRIDRTPVIEDGRRVIRREITKQGRVLAARRFALTVDRRNGFANPTIIYARGVTNGAPLTAP